MIVADAQTKTTIRNLYGKLFIDKNYSNPIDEQYYEAFMEVTVTPSGNNLRNLAFVQAVGGIFRTISNFSSGTTEKYGISNLPVEEYVDSGFFKEGVPRTFWMNFLLIRSAGTSSQSRVTFVVDKDTGTFFRIP